MGLTSIEDAVLGFVRRVKNDPGVSDLFRDALHELELVLDPKAATTGEPDGDEQPTGEQPTGEQPTGEQPTGEQPTGEQPTGEQPTGEQPSAEDVQAPQGG